MSSTGGLVAWMAESGQSPRLTAPRWWLCALIPIMGLAVLAIGIVTTSAPLTYDEPWYLNTVALLHQKGLTAEFFRGLPGPAGPLYTFVQFGCESLTHLMPPGVRLVNFVGMMVVILLTAVLLKQQSQPADRAWILASS